MLTRSPERAKGVEGFTAKYRVPFDEETEKYSLEMNKC
jgi:hypothetical protein